jgi:hypothetical protein
MLYCRGDGSSHVDVIAGLGKENAESLGHQLAVLDD